MFNIIKNEKGTQLKEPEDKYVIEMIDGSMIEGESFRELAAAVIGSEYLDCETAETEWIIRLAAAKRIGLMILSNEDDAKTIVYDQRIGKIPYSYTDYSDPDYKIPEDAELIRVECDETFLLSLIKMNYIRIWERVKSNYDNYIKGKDVDQEIEKHLIQFKDKIINIPLYEKLQ